jgi:cyanophycinase
MARRSWLFALSVAASLAHAPQQRPAWPQPLIKGNVVVWQGEKGKDAARAAFQQLMGGDGKIVVLGDAREGWSAFPRATFVSRLSAESLEGAKSVWLGSPAAAELADELVAIKASGGTVGLDAESLGRKGLRDLLPFLGQAFAGDTETSVSAIVYQIDEGAVLVAQGRELSGRGEGETTILIAGEKGEGTDTVTVTATRHADLVALKRRQIERGLPAFPSNQPRTPEVKKGTLVIVGGGGLPGEVLERFIAACGGPDAAIVYVPCESAEQISGEPGFVRTLRNAGAKNVTWVHTKDRTKADQDEEFLRPLKDAKGVWFGGGRQWNLVDSYLDTQAHDLMRAVLERGGAIGGSSAGASIQAELLARGDPLGNLNIIAPGYLRGLGFLPGAAVDQHFSQRRRHKDMTLLMQTYPQWLGIGIDEATALVVAGTRAEVLGRGSVFFYDYSKGAPSGETDYTSLKAGESYDLAARRKAD